MRKRQSPGTQCWRDLSHARPWVWPLCTEKMYEQTLLCQIESKTNWCGKGNKTRIGSWNEHGNSYYCQQIFEFNMISHFVNTCILRYCPQDRTQTSLGSWSVLQLSCLPRSEKCVLLQTLAGEVLLTFLFKQLMVIWEFGKQPLITVSYLFKTGQGLY